MEARRRRMCASVFPQSSGFPKHKCCYVRWLATPHEILHNRVLAKKKKKEKTVAHSQCACMLYAKGWVCSDLGIYFMNNRSGLPPEGSAKEQHLYGIKSVERMKVI